MIFDAFYSDPHFGHKNICKHANRPFRSTWEMRDEFIRRYNEVVAHGQTCLWLGDAFFGPIEEAQDILERLNGEKIIIRGNHDKKAKWLVSAGMDVVIEDKFISFQLHDKIARACHYPYPYGKDRHDKETQELYPAKRKHEILVHGHTHLQRQRYGNQIHVGVDAWAYAPVTFEEVVELARVI